MDRKYLSSDDDNDNDNEFDEDLGKYLADLERAIILQRHDLRSDELGRVSLPGVGDNEQPTILEVLNRGIVGTEDGNGNGNVKTNCTETEAKIESGSTKEIGEQNTGDTVNTIKVTSTLEDDELKQKEEFSKNDKESDNLVSSSSDYRRRQTEWKKPQRSLAEDEENIFDIESHLIETLNNYSVSEDSELWGVDIKELPPAEGETLDRTSKIETDPLIGTVFEVEPAIPKVLKPIETSVQESGLAHNAQFEQISPEKEVEKADVLLTKPVSEEEILEQISPEKGVQKADVLLTEPVFEQELLKQISPEKEVEKADVLLTEPVSEQKLIEQNSPEKEVEKADVLLTDAVDDQELEILLEGLKIDKPIWTIVKEIQEQLEVRNTNRAETTEPQTKNTGNELNVDRGNPLSKTRPGEETGIKEESVGNKSPHSNEKPIVNTDPTKSQSLETEADPKPTSQKESIEISNKQRSSSLEEQVNPIEVKLKIDENPDSDKGSTTDPKVEQSEAAETEKAHTRVQKESTYNTDLKSSEIKSSPQIDSEESATFVTKKSTKDLEAEIEVIRQPAPAEIQKTDPEVIPAKREQDTLISVDQVDHSAANVDSFGLKIGREFETATETLKAKSIQKQDPEIPSVESARSPSEDITLSEVDISLIEEAVQRTRLEAQETNAQSNQVTKPAEEIPAFNPFESVKVVSEISEIQDSGGSILENTTKTEIEPRTPDPQITTKDEISASKANNDIKTDLQSKKLESRTLSTEESTALSKEIDQKLSELTTHLTTVDLNGNIPKDSSFIETAVDVNGLPLPKNAQEEEQRQQFLDSLPQISPETDSNKVAALAKREYYQSLRQYLINHSDKPPIPPETYRWEDLKRAKQRGGYPWTHLYKRPLGPDEEPEIVLLLRKSQELRFSESPKSFKKVRIDDQVSIKETERYIQELSDTEDNPPTEDEKEEQEDAQSECISCVSDSVLTCEKRASKLGKIRGILKKRSPRKELDARSLPDTTSAPRPSLSSTHKSEEDISERESRRPNKDGPNKAKCFPIMKKLRSMADRQKKNFQNIKKISLRKDEKISLEEEQKIIKLKTSPKAERSEIPHFIEKQDSDDVLEIVELDESPSRKRKDQLELQEQAAAAITTGSVLVPDEIIEIPTKQENGLLDRQQTPEPTVSEILEEELKSEAVAAPPKKTARLRREHVYEDIEAQSGGAVSEEVDSILEVASVEALKHSLAKQDSSILKDVEATKTALPLERMGSSEEEVERSQLAPISSIDSASSDDERKPHLSTVAEESDDGAAGDKDVSTKLTTVPEVVKESSEHIPWNDIELKPALKKEPSPSPSDKKVTFSHVEDEAEPHREDIELPEGLSGIGPKRWSNLSDHEYEPIGEPAKEPPQPTVESETLSSLKRESSPALISASTTIPTPTTAVPPSAPIQELPKLEIQQPSPDATSEEASPSPQPDELQQVEELQREIEDRYFSSAATTPRTESQTDYDVHTSQVDSSALEELPLKPENRKKGFMASAQDRTRKMQAGLKTQAGKIKTKFRSPKKAPSGSPKAKERKRFKDPEFSKIKMPEMKRPDLSGFKRPEFTKFSKPAMSKFKLPDKFSSLKLTRSKSFKETTEVDDTTVSGTTPEDTTAPTAAAPPKKPRFDFSFGTYPRAFKKKKKPIEVESTVETPSVIPSTETQPSAESSSTPQGDRGPGPVRSRWADKFSDVSYNDSEGSRYRRYGSEQESSFDRESSMERRMKEVLEENAKEEAELAMLSVVEQKEFADYDEENRVIHEISKTREREFKRRPIVHQDSDLISEEGRDIGWTQREAEKNRLLRKSELEAEEHLRFLSERMSNQDTHSTASSKKFVFEEINDDEFLLRKKGISQEFNIPNQKFIDNSPNGIDGSSIDRMDFGYDVPPPKPRRLSHQQRRRYYDSENASQVEEYPDDVSFSQTGSDFLKEGPPSRPLRKGRFKNSQEISIGGTPSVQYEDDEKENITASAVPPPQAPRRRRKQQRESLEKDSYINGFGGRSVSNSYLKEDNKPEEVIVYRTEHKYKIPLATPEVSSTVPSVTPRKSRSLSRLGMDDDDRTSRGIDSINLELAARENNIREAEDDKYIIEMMENDGYAVVRKENLPKPTPPARRKKFSRSPGERFATMPHMRKGSPAVGLEQKPYSTIGRPTPPRRKSAQSLGVGSQKDFGSADFDDYEVPEFTDRTESPRNLQSGDIINKMKYRPLPPPPRPPREKRHTPRDRHGDDEDEFDSRDDRDDHDDRDDRDGGGERTIFQDFHEISSDDYNQEDHMDKSVEVEVSTQTDPLPDDFVCEEFEITDDMKIIEPRRTKTLDEILKEEEEAELERARQIDEEVLLRGIQRFREANQRSVSEKSRASSQAKSLSRPQTPSAILIEKRVPTPVPNANGQTVLEASLIVQPIDDLDLEEELLRREGLYDGSHSKSDGDSRYKDEEAHASEEENAMVGEEEHSHSYTTDAEVHRSDEDDKEEQRLRLEELRLEEERLEEERLEEERLEAERLEEDRLEEERLKEQSLEEQRIEEQRLLEQRLLEEEEEEERLLEELEKEQTLLDQKEMIKLLLETKERAQKLREEEEENRRLRDELEIQKRLLLDSRQETDDELDEQSDRLKLKDSDEQEPEIEHRASPPPPAKEEPIVSSAKSQLVESQPPEKPTDETHDQPAISPPPLAPPRKRSYAAPTSDDQPESQLVTEEKSSTEPVPFTGVMPSHLALADLEVERLRVHALQAGQIMVSHLHGGQVQAEELECRSGNLVVGNIELPPGFIENIVERVRSTEREHTQAATQTITEVKTQTDDDSIPPPPIPMRQSDIPPVRPPPPQREAVFPTEFMPSVSAPFLQLRDPDETPILPRSVHPAEYLHSGPPIGFYRTPDDAVEPAPPVYRRRRHHRRRDSSSEEDHQRRRSRSSRPETQTVAQAGRQFISACSLPLINVLNQLTNTVRPNNDNKQDQVQPRNISAVIVLFVVMTLSLLIYLLTGRNIHHHHWDYFNPPGNDGRLS